jgi:hypothetical protein
MKESIRRRLFWAFALVALGALSALATPGRAAAYECSAFCNTGGSFCEYNPAGDTTCWNSGAGCYTTGGCPI